jgi:hypothetical protein
MRTLLFGIMCASIMTATVAINPTPTSAATATNWYAGYVVHVSANNIKVANKARTQILSFEVVPHFKNIWSADGKTTYQMARIKPGMIVRILYDQKLLGVRHADKIYILNTWGQPIKATGS